VAFELYDVSRDLDLELVEAVDRVLEHPEEGARVKVGWLSRCQRSLPQCELERAPEQCLSMCAVFAVAVVGVDKNDVSPRQHRVGDGQLVWSWHSASARLSVSSSSAVGSRALLAPLGCNGRSMPAAHGSTEKALNDRCRAC
jgi:hypothetical protein